MVLGRFEFYVGMEQMLIGWIYINTVHDKAYIGMEHMLIGYITTYAYHVSFCHVETKWKMKIV